jgi:hypothetical protein
MNAKAVAILSDPQPCGHIVYAYTGEAQITEAVRLFAGAGFRKGEAVLLIMTEPHCAPILERLEQDNFDVASLTKSGQLVCQEACQLLSTFLFDGIVDEHRFKSKIDGMIDRARAAGGEKRPVRVFGEMVSLIRQSRPQATQRLEELWNEVIQKQAVPLLCAYALAGHQSDRVPDSLLACHSHAIS